MIVRRLPISLLFLLSLLYLNGCGGSSTGGDDRGSNLPPTPTPTAPGAALSTLETLPTPAPSARPTATASSFPTPSLRPSLRPSPVPAPSLPPASPTVPPPPTAGATTVAGSVLRSGQAWHSDGWSLTVSGFTYQTFHTVSFALRNGTGRTVILPEFSTEQFKIVADTGELFAPCSIKGSGWYNTWWSTVGQTEMAPGEVLEWEWDFHPYDPEHRACDSYSHSAPAFPSEARHLTLTVEDLAGVVRQARWQADIPRP